MKFWRKLCFWFRRRRFEEELAEEMRFHRQFRARRLVSDGMEPGLAEREATRQFGNELRHREASGDIWIARWLQDGLHDLRFTARTMSKRPAFAIVAIATLGLGIGGTTAVYSAVHAVLLAPLPYWDAGRVIVVWDRHRRDRESQTVATFDDYEAYRQNSKLLDRVTAAALVHPIVGYKGVRRQYQAGMVSPWAFDLLGTPPLFGRTQFLVGSDCSVIVSHRFWTSTLGAGPGAIGQTLDFDGEICTVQAVMPKEFRFFPVRADMWLFIDPSGGKRFRYAAIFARLRPGVTLQQAKAELQAIHAGLHANDDHGRDRTAEADDAQRELTYVVSSTLRPTLIAMFWAVASLLFVACLNVAGMSMARIVERHREFVVRAALGCGRGRLVRHAFAEGAFLCMGGIVLGVLLAAGAVQLIGRKSLTEFPDGVSLSVNAAVLSFAMIAGAVAALLTALAPALFAIRTEIRFPSGIAGHGLGGSTRNLRTSQIMIGGQIAACLVVLAGAALLVDSVFHLETDALGFSTRNVAITGLNLSHYRDPARRNARHLELIEKLQALPSVSTAAIGGFFPPSRDSGDSILELRGRAVSSPTYDVLSTAVSPGFFELLRTPLLKGRIFDAGDRPGGKPVAIVNETLAQEYFPGQDPLGQEVRVVSLSGPSPWLTIAGVVGDWKHMEWDARWLVSPMVFRPLAQDPSVDGAIAVRTLGNPAGLARAISAQIQSAESSMPSEPVETLDSRLEKMRAYPRFRAFIVSFFALATLLITAVGLHGTLAEFVSRRVPEFGLRRAIGARTVHLFWLVIRQGGLPVVGGLAAGAVAAPALARIVRSLLVGFRLWNPTSLVWPVVLLVTVAAIAIAFPARRAANVDPMAALREE
jgi:predicted permease